MKKWLQKSIVITVALLTFGLITPTHEIWDSLDQSRTKNSEIQPTNSDSITDYIGVAVEEPSIEEDEDTRTTLLIAAKEQSYTKFGSRIAPKISDDFENYILPKMQEAIDMTIARLDDDKLKSLAISENPSGAYTERIFNIYSVAEGQDLIRFHVRTENRPQEGYYYNFHYHTKEDQFASHYDLGEIYWSKNTPPKWLS